jgi:eukaryotic-like serine/threonine-protein kinase
MDLDSYVDALEDAVSMKGVLAIDLIQFAPPRDTLHGEASDRLDILVEMLRVWMEHRWHVGYPVTVQDCLNEFPTERFRDSDRERLQFEDRRLKQSTDDRSEELRNGSITNSSRSHARSMDELPNTGTTWDDFELLAILGAGAFAKVYLARQRGMANRLVALKLSFCKTHESDWLATLQHSAIVPIYSRHSHQSIYGICMPYLGNTTLADVLRESPILTQAVRSPWWLSRPSASSVGKNAMLNTIEQRQREIDTIVQTNSDSLSANSNAGPKSEIPLPMNGGLQTESSLESTTRNNATRSELSLRSYVDAICWIGAELADALSYAHRNGIIHSDIKPANVLLGSDGQPRLLDFNVSYRGSDSGWIHGETSLGGTIPYMSPEHRKAFLEPQSVDARSDVYSLGVVLFEMLTGGMPHKNAARGDDPSKWNPTVSPATSAIVRKCLRTDPNERYASANELRDDLNAQFHHLPLIHQSEPSLSERIFKWSHRHPRFSSSVSILSIASILIGSLIAGIVVRDSALRRADWSHRIDVLRQRIPNSMAMLTSLQAVPELEADVVEDLNQTFGLIATKRWGKSTLDPQWNSAERDRDIVGTDLRSTLGVMHWLAKQHSWTRSPELLQELSVDGNEREGTNLHTMQLIREQRYYDAIPLLTQRVSDNPRDYVGWWLLGGCYQSIQNFSGAKQSFAICIALQPNTAIAYFNRGMASFSLTQYEAAAEDFQRSASISNWPWPLLNQALSLQMMGRIDEAIAALDQAIENGYATVSTYRLLAELHQSKGNNEAAVADIQDAMGCVPVSDQQWIDRGLIQLETAPLKAVADFERALDVNPHSVDAHQKLAYVYSELLKNPSKSLEHSDQLVALAPRQPTHLAGRAVLHARAGGIDAAQADLRELESMNTREGTIREGVVMYQVACGYSLLGERQGSNEQSSSSLSKSGFHWLANSIRSDPSVWLILQADPDAKWLREQPQFQQFTEAVKTLEVISP